MDQKSVLIGSPYHTVDGIWSGQAYLYTIVPEPMSITLAGLGFVALGFAVCRRRSRS
ncbi:PEP-CTERM sorting domain-containing protein [Aeoliella sp. ICT_H6.2]|uniref:PEP-CTERM sorting domain-containing protein n=1 Tax=Aeoliella straminimaris TaxID=2954799 RepID=A0A9X2F884_9BACT|nr:PEP-CTERM sorting domain-containing protein [Aeoliella straminimaris]MCO6043463.1 PEP-CTERM sorting domain-containing protein [Aeoliella straminimaris]